MSKAFGKAMKYLHTILSLSTNFLMVFIKLISACSVESSERKQNWLVLIYLYWNTFFLSRQKFYIFIAFTDLRVISKLLRYHSLPFKRKTGKKTAFPFLKTRSFNFMPLMNNLNQKVRVIYDEFGPLPIRIKKSRH